MPAASTNAFLHSPLPGHLAAAGARGLLRRIGRHTALTAYGRGQVDGCASHLPALLSQIPFK
ncbi:MAG: hypothetical protein ACOXZM_09190 [Eubacteriales bacterium]